MSLEIKSCVLDSWDFFPKIESGLPIKSQEIRSQEKSPNKSKDYWLLIGCLQPGLFFPLWIMHFHLLEGVFVLNHTGARKKVLGNKVSNW